jgi:hypothetical protein
MASWLSHTPARQENAGGRALEQNDNMVADLTGAGRRCQEALVVGEVGHFLGSFSKVGGCSGTCTRGWKVGEAARH